ALQRAGAFQLKPLWQRAAVVAAGPVANFLSAILMFAAVAYFVGIRIEPAVLKVRPLNPALLAGLQTGDLVVKADGIEVKNF
ncbi:site-2 protease family protein, partial [Brucella intermedia]|uniref:site-2 protease family protein n=1 Tax=Brucella intermedia TaxID=94625 RepID=UPI00236196DE